MLFGDSAVENNNDAGIRFIAYEPSESLFELNDGGRELKLEKWISALCLDHFDAALYERVVWNGKRQTDNYHVGQRFAGHVDALPEAVGSEKYAAVVVSESLEQNGAVDAAALY
jgi:hypothetical protein